MVSTSPDVLTLHMVHSEYLLAYELDKLDIFYSPLQIKADT